MRLVTEKQFLRQEEVTMRRLYLRVRYRPRKFDLSFHLENFPGSLLRTILGSRLVRNVLGAIVCLSILGSQQKALDMQARTPAVYQVTAERQF
jgi:hypothetical protein